MKKLFAFVKIFVLAAMITYPANVSAQNLLANVSPAEFAALYQYYVRSMSNIFGSSAAMDYSKYLIKDVWHNPEKNDMYAIFINEDYESGKNNLIYLIAGNNSADKEIYTILVEVENNFENLSDSLFLESSVSLACLNVKNFDSDRLRRVIDGLDNEYKFFDSSAGKNILIKRMTGKNSGGYDWTGIVISED